MYDEHWIKKELPHTHKHAIKAEMRFRLYLHLFSEFGEKMKKVKNTFNVHIKKHGPRFLYSHEDFFHAETK